MNKAAIEGQLNAGRRQAVPTKRQPARSFASAWGGFAEYLIANDHEAMLAAGLLYSWREVYDAFEDFHLKEGDNIPVFGAGPDTDPPA